MHRLGKTFLQSDFQCAPMPIPSWGWLSVFLSVKLGTAEIRKLQASIVSRASFLVHRVQRISKGSSLVMLSPLGGENAELGGEAPRLTEIKGCFLNCSPGGSSSSQSSPIREITNSKWPYPNSYFLRCLKLNVRSNLVGLEGSLRTSSAALSN